MKDGKVDGVGNHETLLRTNEHYKKCTIQNNMRNYDENG